MASNLLDHSFLSLKVLIHNSFGDGNLLFTLEIDAKSEIEDFSLSKGLISSYVDSERKVYSYRIVFKNRQDLIAFRNKFIKDERVLNIRSDLQS